MSPVTFLWESELPDNGVKPISKAAPAPHPVLRPYQLQAVEATFKAWETERTALVVMATGLGKTLLASEVMRRTKGRCLFLCHLEELLQNARSSIEALTGEQVGIERGKERSGGERLIVGTIQTVSRRLAKYPKSAFDVIIIDECFTGDTQIRAIGEIQSVSSKDAPDVLIGIDGVVSTEDHPYLTSDGWKRAADVKIGDMLCVWELDPSQEENEDDVLPRVRIEEVERDYDLHQSCSRFCKAEERQYYSPSRGEGEAEQDSAKHGAYASYNRRERPWAFAHGSPLIGGYGAKSVYTDHARRRKAISLQVGPSVSIRETNHRGGWVHSQKPGWKNERSAEGQALAWKRVDSVEVHKRGGEGRYTEVCPEGKVYNIQTSSGLYLAGGRLVHNCHHAGSASYKQALAYFHCKVLGVTATPARGMGLGLAVFNYGIKDGVRDGWLVPIEGRQIVVDSIKLTRVKVSKDTSDFDQSGLDEAMQKAASGIADVIAGLPKESRGVLFFPGCKSAQLTSELLNARQEGCSIYVDGEIRGDDRRALIGRLRAGEARWLCNVGIATEGFDLPSANTIGMCCPTLSQTGYVQRAGRGTRTFGADLSGDAAERRLAIVNSPKPKMTILDFCGASDKVSLVASAVLEEDFSAYESEYSGLESQRREDSGTDERGSAGDDHSEYLSRDVLARSERARGVARSIQSRTVHRVVEFDPFGEPGSQTERGVSSSSSLSENASEKQQALLKRYGVECTGLTKLQATKMVQYIASSGWRLPKSGAAILDKIREKNKGQ